MAQAHYTPKRVNNRFTHGLILKHIQKELCAITIEKHNLTLTAEARQIIVEKE